MKSRSISLILLFLILALCKAKERNLQKQQKQQENINQSQTTQKILDHQVNKQVNQPKQQIKKPQIVTQAEDIKNNKQTKYKQQKHKSQQQENIKKDDKQQTNIQNNQDKSINQRNQSQIQQKKEQKLLQKQGQIVDGQQQQQQIQQIWEQQAVDENNSQQKTMDQNFYCGKTAYIKPYSLFREQNSSREILIQTNYGFNMYVDSKDYSISKEIATTGTWQPHYINLIGHLLKPTDNVLNLGSHVGLEAIIMGKIIKPKGKLFIFEPYSFSYEILKKNIKLNGLNKITTIYKVGASDQKAVGNIKVYYSNTGGSQIQVLPRGQSEMHKINPSIGQVEEVQLDTVDNLLPKDIQLNFAFIDVQKMEIKALKGMKNVIDRSPNLIIMFEWQFTNNRGATRKQAEQILRFLFSKGYKVYTYSGGDVPNCKIGQFYQITDKQTLFRTHFLDIFLFPKTISPPRSS